MSPLPVLVVGVVLFFVVSVIFFPLFSYVNPKPAPGQLEGMGHAKQCGLAMAIYRPENDGIFPYAQDQPTLANVLKPYLPDSDVWNTLNPGKPGKFAFNYSLGGVYAKVVVRPEETPLILDPFARHPRNSSDWIFLSCFADGHTKYVPEAHWPQYRANLSLGLKHHGKPLK